MIITFINSENRDFIHDSLRTENWMKCSEITKHKTSQYPFDQIYIVSTLKKMIQLFLTKELIICRLH